jgi:hypothetical protein
MKLFMVISFLLGSLMVSNHSYASDSSSNTSNPKDQKQATQMTKKKRRKKVLMCQECGKPETECDCEGHGDNEAEHRVHEDEHKNNHDDKKEIKK